MALVVVFGASGRLGRRVSVEAADRGHHVIGVVHREAIPLFGQGVETVEGDVTDLATVRRVSQSADVLVVTVGGPDKSLYLDAARTLVAVAQEMAERAPRIIHSGGGGSLLDPNGSRFVDTHGFPEAVRPEVRGQAVALDCYRTTSGADWVYMSPPPGNFEPGDRTGTTESERITQSSTCRAGSGSPTRTTPLRLSTRSTIPAITTNASPSDTDHPTETP